MLIHALAAILTISLFTTFGGIWIASRKPEWYTTKRLQLFVALGTGVLLGIGFLEFLPVSFEAGGENAPLFILLGLLFIIFVETQVAPHLDFLEGQSCDHDHAKDHDHKDHPSQEHAHHFISHQAACSAVGCLIVCAFFDGFKVFSAFSVGTVEGWLIASGLFFHILPDGVLAASIALAGGMSRSRAMKVSWITGGSIVVGAFFSWGLGEMIGGTSFVLPFASGILIYVTLIHLLPVGAKHRHGLKVMSLGLLLYILLHFFTHEGGALGHHTHAFNDSPKSFNSELKMT